VLATAALLPLLETFVSILVVDLAGFGVGECFVRFCYLDKFLLGAFIATTRLLVRAWPLRRRMGAIRVLIGVVFFAEGSVGSFNVLF